MGDNVGTIFGWPAPKIWDGEKRSKSGAFSDNFGRWSRISPERIHKSKIEKVVDQLYNPSYVGWKKVGELWSTNKKVIDVHYWPTQVDIVRETIFLWCSLKFLYALEIAQDLLTHIQTGTPPPQKKIKIDDENLNLALITSGIEGIFSPDFSRPRPTWWTLVHKRKKKL